MLGPPGQAPSLALPRCDGGGDLLPLTAEGGADLTPGPFPVRERGALAEPVRRCPPGLVAHAWIPRLRGNDSPMTVLGTIHRAPTPRLPYLRKRSSLAMGSMIVSGACTLVEERNEGGV